MQRMFFFNSYYLTFKITALRFLPNAFLESITPSLAL